MQRHFLYILLHFIFFPIFLISFVQAQDTLKINELEYLEMPGLNVMLAHDFYPEGHQGGVGIIQNGKRVATNGDIRLEPTPGQWEPIPMVGKREVDRTNNIISVRMEYPDTSRDKKGFNPIDYPDLQFKYNLKIHPEGKSFRIIVDLEKPLPDDWIGKVGFNLELFPGSLFGKSFYMDEKPGLFPRQLNGPEFTGPDLAEDMNPIVEGKVFTVAPESDEQRMRIEVISGQNLQLYDGRALHNNGWYVLRCLINKGVTEKAIDWLVTPNAIPGFLSDPSIQISQAGYHPKQKKIAVIELDKNDPEIESTELLRINGDGNYETVLNEKPEIWGRFLRFKYLQFDFTGIVKQGIYKIKYGKYFSSTFRIDSTIFSRDVWQPTLEYFLPVQMCHMRVNDRYKVWHDFCHMDDARMAPTDHVHFDGYRQGSETLCKYKPGDHVPGLNQGGWHDAGDYDLRVESQASTIYGLSLAYEQFGSDFDNTTIDQKNHVVEMHHPDGKPDMLQQIEHGALSIVGGYLSLGRLYRGIICPTLRQYVMLGDASSMTDNEVYSGKDVPVGLPGSPDDRWVFTEENAWHEIITATSLAATSRTLKGFNDTLAEHCLQISEEIYNNVETRFPAMKASVAAELLKTTGNRKYADFIVSIKEDLVKFIDRAASVIGPVLPLINDPKFTEEITGAVKAFSEKVAAEEKENPYGVPYKPNIWGAGWQIQHFGYEQYFLHTSFPEIFPDDYMMNSINFILGCHPGSNSESFVSGVGTNSATVAYGVNRDEWSYIPGGIISGTALIRPDYPELLKWPYLWQQTEYVLGGGTSDYIFLIQAADHLLNSK